MNVTIYSSARESLIIHAITDTGLADLRNGRFDKMFPEIRNDWTTLFRLIAHLLSVHCRGQERILRPFDLSVQGTKPNDLPKLEYIGRSSGTYEQIYSFMLRDDHSSNFCLLPFPDTSAENSGQAIVDWCAPFGVPNGLLTVGLTHSGIKRVL